MLGPLPGSMDTTVNETGIVFVFMDLTFDQQEIHNMQLRISS